MADELEKQYAKAFKAAYPRKIVVPSGYADPKAYSATLVGDLLVTQDPRMRATAHLTAYLGAMALIANKVPTYFVAPEFALAVANTDLPGDFKFAELRWPLNAQIFVLPDEFVAQYYGNCYAPFLSVSRLQKGDYPGGFGKMPEVEVPLMPVGINVDKMIIDFPAFLGLDMPTDYNGNYPMNLGVEVFKTAPWADMTGYEEKAHGVVFDRRHELNKEEENEFIQKALQLAVKLILTIAERPGLVEHGTVTRHAKVHQGRVIQPQLVSANVIGRTYRIRREITSHAVAASGQRRPPRFKYRRGHLTWQAKRFKNLEFISVDQMPRKEEGIIDFDAAGELLSGKFRACHERKWIEGFLFEDKEEQPNSGNTP